jgi:enamine deaminase RidA (YjgF/YER057c/UK114 family)
VTRPELAFVGQIEPDARRSDAPVAEQARGVLGRLADTLAERGLSLDDLLRLRLFVADLAEMAAIEETLQTHLSAERPAVSVVELPPSPREERDDPRAAVALDAVAAPDAREHRRLATHSARLGPWVFVGAIPAHEPRELFARMRELLGEQGAELRDVMRIGSWLTFPMRAYGPLGEVRQELVATADLLPASSGVQVGRVGLTGESLSCEALAYAPADRGTHEPHVSAEQPPISGEPPPGATSRLADFYVDARSAGGYVFTSGEVPDCRGSVGEQAKEVYERLRAHLTSSDATPASVVQQSVFVRHARDREAVTQAGHAFFGATPPPTTMLTVADIGFRPGCDVEIELVATTDG